MALKRPRSTEQAADIVNKRVRCQEDAEADQDYDSAQSQRRTIELEDDTNELQSECSKEVPVTKPLLQMDSTTSAKRVWHFDQLTAVLRETLPENQRGRWDAVVDKLKMRVAERPQFGENVNGFLMVLHKQMEACKGMDARPSAKATLFHFVQQKLGHIHQHRLASGKTNEGSKPVAAS